VSVGIRRRNFVRLLAASALVVPHLARGQGAQAVRRIAVLMPNFQEDSQTQDRVKAFEQSLRDRGWIAGRNLRIDYRFAGPDLNRLRSGAAELVALHPEVVLTASSLALPALQQATHAIPIVFVGIFDSVGIGFVANFAHPEGNITGLTLGENTLGEKWLEALKEIAPAVDHATVMYNPDQAPNVSILHRIEATGSGAGIRVAAAPVREAAAIAPAIEAAAREPNGGLIVVPSPLTAAHREELTALAASRRVPAVYGLREMVVGGGLISYGASLVEQFRSAGDYVDHILKGAKPAELPVQQPTRFELVVNLKAAKAIELAVPSSILLRADEVIE